MVVSCLLTLFSLDSLFIFLEPPDLEKSLKFLKVYRFNHFLIINFLRFMKKRYTNNVRKCKRNVVLNSDAGEVHTDVAYCYYEGSHCIVQQFCPQIQGR